MNRKRYRSRYKDAVGHFTDQMKENLSCLWFMIKIAAIIGLMLLVFSYF